MGLLGIIHPPGSHGPLHECPRLYFTIDFLGDPPMFWTFEPNGDQWPGSLITLETKVMKRIWRLTGHYEMTGGGMAAMEAVWPD